MFAVWRAVFVAGGERNQVSRKKLGFCGASDSAGSYHYWSRTEVMRSAVLLLVLLLAGCVRGEVEEPLSFRVYVPAVAHDCSWICADVAEREALLRCEAEMMRLRNEEQRAREVDDCRGERLLPFLAR